MNDEARTITLTRTELFEICDVLSWKAELDMRAAADAEDPRAREVHRNRATFRRQLIDGLLIAWDGAPTVKTA